VRCVHAETVSSTAARSSTRPEDVAGTPPSRRARKAPSAIAPATPTASARAPASRDSQATASATPSATGAARGRARRQRGALPAARAGRKTGQERASRAIAGAATSAPAAPCGSSLTAQLEHEEEDRGRWRRTPDAAIAHDGRRSAGRGGQAVEQSARPSRCRPRMKKLPRSAVSSGEQRRKTRTVSASTAARTKAPGQADHREPRRGAAQSSRPAWLRRDAAGSSGSGACRARDTGEC